MDPFTISVSTVALVGASIKTTLALKNLKSGYRESESHQVHVHRQKELLRANQALLDDQSLLNLNYTKYLQSSLKDIQNALPSQLPSNRRRNRLKWVVSGKGKAKTEIAKLKDTEISAIFTLLLAVSDKMIETDERIALGNSHLSSQTHQLTSVEKRLQKLETYAAIQRLDEVTGNTCVRQSQTSEAKVQVCHWLLRLGITLRLITTGDYSSDEANSYSLLISWPLCCSMVLVWRMSIVQGRPRFASLSLKPKTVVPEESDIIQSCKKNDIARMRQIFQKRQADPASYTPDNLTLLRFAIREGHIDIVRFLLENGADANQTFGRRETSPLNAAFLTGNVEIIRLLLSADADLEYVNTKTWTSIYYLWGSDPNWKHHASTEILNICATYGFKGWRSPDRSGWAPIHRAAAFGRAEDITKLFNMRVVDRWNPPLTVAYWCPLQCAARYGNLSTFKALTSEYRFQNSALSSIRDQRGWTLLHLAAASGSEGMLSHLLSIGLNQHTLSDKATLLLPPELENRHLAPGDIAEHYGHGVVYVNCLADAEPSTKLRETGDH